MIITLLFAALTLVLTPSVQAEETATGTTIEDDIAFSGSLLRQQLEEETADFYTLYVHNKASEVQYHQQQQERIDMRNEKRIQCRRDVRTANKNTIQQVTLSCYRAILSLEREMLRKELQFINTIAGVDDELRTSAKHYTNELMDAITTVINAIDAGVFYTREQMEEAKKNLGIRYRINKRIAVARLYISREQTWITHMMLRVLDVLEQEPLTEASTNMLKNTLQCMKDRKEDLSGLFLLTDNKALLEDFRQVQSGIKFCIDSIQEAKLLNTEFEQEEEYTE